MPVKYIKVADRKAEDGGPSKSKRRQKHVKAKPIAKDASTGRFVPNGRTALADAPAGTPGLTARDARRDPAVLEKVLNAVMLRKAGGTYLQIGKNLGIGEDTARKYVVEEMNRLTDDIQEAAKEHRQLQLERLNEMIMGYWPRRTDPKFGAMILSLMSKQDHLLGIASEKIDLTVTQNEFEKMSDLDLDEFLEKKMAAMKKPVPLAMRGGE